MPTIILGKKDVNELLNMSEVVHELEDTFRNTARGKTIMPAKVYLTVAKGDFRAMPAYIPGGTGIKWVNVHPENPEQGLPTVMAVIIYSDPLTGYPLAVMDGTDITAARTGATAAIASKYLARKSSHTLGIIGAGRQAYSQMQAHLELFHFDSILVYDKLPAAVERFTKYFSKYPVKAAGLAETAGSDILCTLTPSKEPYLEKQWLKTSVHINAVGADAKGKEELDPDILTSARVVVDDVHQAADGGEINVPISKGIFSLQKIYATLSEVVNGNKPGRTGEREITVFDSTGLAVEDIAVAKSIYEKAKLRSSYLSFELVD